MSMRQWQIQTPLRESMSDSALPLVHQFYVDHKEHMDKLLTRTRVHIYRSPVDFILVEFFPKMRRACILFYLEKGKPFSELYTGEYQELVDLWIHHWLPALLEQPWKSWDSFMQLVHHNV